MSIHSVYDLENNKSILKKNQDEDWYPVDHQ